MSRRIERLGCLTALGLVLYELGAELGNAGWAYACIFALVLVMEWLSYVEGVADGMMIYHQLTPEQRDQIEQLIREEE